MGSAARTSIAGWSAMNEEASQLWRSDPIGRARVPIRSRPRPRTGSSPCAGSHLSWGLIRLQYHLEREGLEVVPSHMAIYQALVRHHLIEQKCTKRSESSVTDQALPHIRFSSLRDRVERLVSRTEPC